jgi:predicted membrane-bound spermidine synthase
MLVMILIYQNAHGIVYYRISLINALFMLGLAMGAYAAGRRPLGLTPVMGGISLSLGLVLANTYLGSDALFWPLLVAVAFLCGSVFTLLFQRSGGSAGLASASVLDSMDNFGAIAGSLLTVTLFLPVLGIQGTIVLSMALALPAALVARFWLRAREK